MFVVYHSILFRETKEEYDFNNAVHACTADFHHSAIAMATGLIPVGKLRCLRNKYDYDPSAERDLDDHFCSRFYRVNGRKDNMGIWREYPSGLYQSYNRWFGCWWFPQLGTNMTYRKYWKVSRAYFNFLKFFCGFTFKLVYYLKVIV